MPLGRPSVRPPVPAPRRTATFDHKIRYPGLHTMVDVCACVVVDTCLADALQNNGEIVQDVLHAVQLFVEPATNLHVREVDVNVNAHIIL